MASAYATGVVHVWVFQPPVSLSAGYVSTTPTTANSLYIGTGEKAPRPRFKRHFLPAHTDGSGPVVPDEKIWLGSEAFVSVALTRWNEKNVRSLLASPHATLNLAAAGNETPLDRGTMMRRELQTYQLLLAYSNSEWKLSPDPTLYPDMPAGYRFLYATLDDDSEHEPGTGPNRWHLMWYCMNGPGLPNPAVTTRVPFTGGSISIPGAANTGSILWDNEVPASFSFPERLQEERDQNE